MLIAACADEAGLTADEWAEQLESDRWSTADRNELFANALAVDPSAQHRYEDMFAGATVRR